jgi:hypothetical protein
LIVEIDRLAGTARKDGQEKARNMNLEATHVRLVPDGADDEQSYHCFRLRVGPGTFDNLAAAECRVVGNLPSHEESTSWPKRLRAWLQSRA